MRRVILIAVVFALFGCDDVSQFPQKEWKRSITQCREEASENNTSDPDYILACMTTAGFEPLSEDEAADICFSERVYDTPGCWKQR
jgi:hypothetical protein